MGNHKREKVICLSLIIVLICVLLYSIGKLSHTYKPVKIAVSKKEARQYLEEEGYFIIYYKYIKPVCCESKWILYYTDGEKKGPVVLIGNNPYTMYDLDNTIFSSKQNKILVKGTIEENYSQYARETVICVDEWEIIAPIKREYSLGNRIEYKYDYRLFYPKDYIDEYDVKKGNFIPNTVGQQILQWFETDYLLETEENYYIIESNKVGNEIKWYLLNIGKEKLDEEREIIMTGDSPELHFSDVMLEGSGISGMYFLVKGNYQENNNTLEIEQWQIESSIWRDTYDSERQCSKYYLDENDIKVGNYIP